MRGSSKEDVANDKIIKTRVPLPQYSWARGGIKDVKIMPFNQGSCDEEIELCPNCYEKIGNLMENIGLKSKSWSE